MIFFSLKTWGGRMVLFKTLGGSGPPDPHLRHAHAREAKGPDFKYLEKASYRLVVSPPTKNFSNLAQLEIV